MTAAVPTDAAAGEKLIAVATELTQLLERETAFVRALTIAEIGPLQADKIRLTKLLQDALKQLSSGPGLAPSLKPKWLAAGRRLADAVIANERALRVGRAATERLVAAIVAAITQSRRPFRTYAPPRRRTVARELSGVSVDRRL